MPQPQGNVFRLDQMSGRFIPGPNAAGSVGDGTVIVSGAPDKESAYQNGQLVTRP
jgi:hypothetical protein